MNVHDSALVIKAYHGEILNCHKYIFTFSIPLEFTSINFFGLPDAFSNKKTHFHYHVYTKEVHPDL